MLRSMTGFASCEAREEWGTLSWEIRTVNHRYLDISLRLPEEFRVQEPAYREAVARRVRRGKVEATLRYRPAATTPDSLVLEEDLLSQLIEAAERVASRLPDALPARGIDYLRWPGVLKEAERDLSPLHAAALALLEQTLTQLAQAREREGGRIDTMLTTRADAIAAQVAVVRSRLPEVQQNFRSRLEQRLAQIEGEADPQRLEQELVMLAQRLDVDEELDRLDSHLAEMRVALSSDEAVGRRLDFLLQEFNREANTLGSKSQDADTTRAAVELKVLIEQMREQIQNVE